MPKISLVIPAFDEEASIARLLTSVAAQRVMPHEVILVDAGSADETVKLARGFTGRLPLRILSLGRLNPGEARNAGAAEADAEWIAFADAGTVLDPGWLAALAAEMAPDVDVVFGSYEPHAPTLFARAAAVAFVPPRSREGIRGPAAVSMAIRAEAFRRSSGFPRFRAAEDLLFFDAVRAAGLRVRYAPTAVVCWETPPGLPSTFRKFACYSEANLHAGYARYWHRGLARQYVVVGIGMGLATATVGEWLALALLPAWFIARALVAACRKRGDLPFSTLVPSVVATAALLLVVIDAATWIGLLRYLRRWTNG